jgi:hypothetical protein
MEIRNSPPASSVASTQAAGQANAALKAEYSAAAESPGLLEKAKAFGRDLLGVARLLLPTEESAKFRRQVIQNIR